VSGKWVPFGIAALAVLLLAVFAYTNLEIYPRTVYRPPSRQVRVNDFFALETWLARTGRQVYTAAGGDVSRITGASAKTAFIQASAFDWNGAAGPLKNWMAAGGFLVISLEPPLDEDEELGAFLAEFGVQAVLSGESGNTPGGGDDGMDEAVPFSRPFPDFDGLVQFDIMEKTGDTVFTIKEAGTIIRLIRIPLGAGALTLTGGSRFMENDYLIREVNARLAWDLTGARAKQDNPGLLFIRGNRQVKSLFGKLADRGNFFPLGLSALALVIVGFWMLIPPFGLLFQEQFSPGRPIRDRFLAETRFLKKYRVLEPYLEIYIQEIRQKLRGREPAPELEAIEKSLREREHLSYRNIIRDLQILETMMERL
jgi:hypothetical protein